MNITGAYSRNVRDKVASATVWSLVDTGVRRGLRFAITLILARILTPTDYGIVAILDMFISLAALFVSAGLPTALIQKKEVSPTELSTIFFVNLGTAIVLAGLLCVSAHSIAAFYHIAILQPLTYIFAANLVIQSGATIQSVLFSRALNIKTQCMMSLIAVPISGTIAVILAVNGYGVWSLAFQVLTTSSLTTLLFWILCPWRPQNTFSVRSISGLFHFGSFMLFSGILDIIFTRLSSVIIGKYYSPRDLGYYSRAESTSLLPGNLMSAVIARVALPVYAAASDDPNLLQRGLRQGLLVSMFFNIPTMIGVIIVANPLIRTLFGQQWIPCVPYLRILCLTGLLWPLHVLNLNVLIAQGRSDILFRLEILKKSIGILILGASCFISVAAIAWSSVLLGLFSFTANSYYSGRFLRYGCYRQSLDLLPYFCAGAAMFGASLTIALIGPATSPVRLVIVQAIAGATTYFAICRLFRLPALLQAWRILITLLPRRGLTAV